VITTIVAWLRRGYALDVSSLPFEFGKALRQMSASPAMTLSVAGQQVMRLLRETFDALDLKPRQFRTLDLLDDRGPMGQRELGDVLGIDHSILVTLLNPLEDAGLLSRDRDPTDRRKHVVSITPDGVTRLHAAAEQLRAVDARLLKGLTGQQQAELSRSLATIMAALGPPGDPMSDDPC
jgi:DNA-binding MarR family transcriptional regulator